MNRKNVFILAAAIIAGFLVLGLTQALAQRFPADERPAAGVGRYQVVRVTADAVLLLDTVTGDLYTAVPSDAKPYNSRPGARDRFDGKKADFDEKKADFLEKKSPAKKAGERPPPE